MLPQDVPDDVADVLGSGIEIAELLCVEVEIFVVEALFYLFLDEVFQVFEIDEVACFRIDFTADFYLQFVIVAVVVGVVAQAENLPVLFVRPGGVVQAMRCIEVGFTENGDAHSEFIKKNRSGREGRLQRPSCPE